MEMEVVKASLLCKIEEEPSNEETSNCLVRRIVICRSAIREFWLRRQAYIKAGILILLAGFYVVYFGYAMYYSFGDEPSIRLLWITCVAFVAMVIKATNHIVSERFSLTSEPRSVALMRRHISIINW